MIIALQDEQLVVKMPHETHSWGVKHQSHQRPSAVNRLFSCSVPGLPPIPAAKQMDDDIKRNTDLPPITVTAILQELGVCHSFCGICRGYDRYLSLWWVLCQQPSQSAAPGDPSGVCAGKRGGRRAHPCSGTTQGTIRVQTPPADEHLLDPPHYGIREESVPVSVVTLTPVPLGLCQTAHGHTCLPRGLTPVMVLPPPTSSSQMMTGPGKAPKKIK